jgi:hypothetical protein
MTGHLINTDAEKQMQRKYNVINECHALDADSLRTPAGVGCTSPFHEGDVARWDQVRRTRRLPRNEHNEITGLPRRGGKRRPCRDGCDGEIFRFFAGYQSDSDRAFNIGSPASSCAIMRRACPYGGEKGGRGKDVRELDTQSRN